MQPWDVIVIGGGPAGSTAATLLAREGHRVRVLDKEHFPRFRIGESLLPISVPVFERLGFDPAKGPYLRKLGAEFIDEAEGRHGKFFFTEALPGTPPSTWQTERGPLDTDLLRIAREAGADVVHGERALDVDFGRDVATVRTDRGEHAARYVIDATGSDAFLARRARAVEPIKGFGIASAFAHYEDVPEDAFAELAETGNVRVLTFEAGWAWLIPIHGRKVSYGVVSSKQGIGLDMLDTIAAASPMIRRAIGGARRTGTWLAGNFSFRNTRPHGARFACAGDSACFLDPIYSSGVGLAMHGAEKLADTLAPALREGREADPHLVDGVAAHMQHAYDTFELLIDAFYSSNLIGALFFYRDPRPDIRSGIITLLAGDVWRDDNVFQNMLLQRKTSGRRRRKR